MLLGFVISFWNFPGGTEGNSGSQNIQSVDREMNPRPLAYEEDVGTA
jgi:hypothetical protein